MKIFYFTATGNCLYVAKRLGDEYYSIPQVIKEGKKEFVDEEIGIVFPIYFTGVPQYIKEFIETVELKCEYLFAVMTYGKYQAGAVKHLQKISKKNGKIFSYINTIVMVDNWLPMFDMKMQIEEEPSKGIEKQIEQINMDIKSKKSFIQHSKWVDNMITSCMTKVDMNKKGKGVTESYSVNDNCTKCGICAKVCPVNNIYVDRKKPIFSQNCISCVACIQNCPQGAIQHKSEKNSVRFRNQHITLDEIIASNK